MKLLTPAQKEWLSDRKIEVGGTYPFPSFGFTVYASPSFANGEYLDTNPFTKSLDYERFTVKEIDSSGIFIRANFAHRPKGADFWLYKGEVEMRGLLEVILLYLICFVPMVMYNQFTKKRGHEIP